jgi:hypothetical protein
MTRASKVPIPDFFIALVLPGASREPTKQECEELRQETIKFWSKRLKDVYPKPFECLDLCFDKAIFGAREQENTHNLGPEFNMYLEVSGEVEFSGKSTAPAGDKVFHDIMGGDSMDYLVDFVRKVTAKSLFATAVKVRARRLKADPNSTAGTVRSPSFYVAFTTELKNHPGPPTKEEVEEFKKRTHKRIIANLKKEYPHNFVSSDMTVLNAEAGTSKPDERFQLYLENDVSATFSSDPPSPMELFSVILKCGTSTKYLTSMDEITGSPFETVTNVKIQMIGMETPSQGPPELLIPPSGPGEGEGDGEGEEEEIITMNAPIFLALVIMTEPPPASKPSEKELADFHDLIHRFFYTLLQKEYPDSLVDMKLNELTTKYEAGIPEKRFNMCMEYDAKIRFKAKGPTPDKKLLQLLIVQCNLSSILTHVGTLKPLCFEHSTEVSMRRKSKKKEAGSSTTEAPFEAAISSPSPNDPPPKKATKKETPKPVLPKPPRKSIKIKKSEPKKEKLPQVQSSDVFVALKLDGIDSEPTPEEYEKLRQQTHEFFVSRLKQVFPKQFVKMDLQISVHEFGAGKPEAKYNVYVEWDVTASFTSSTASSSSPARTVAGNKRTSVKTVDDDSDVPGPSDLTQALVKDVDLMDYLVEYVRKIEDSAFANTTAGYFQQRIGA